VNNRKQKLHPFEEPADAPRNLLRGFPEVQGNFGIRQTYQLWEGVNMQLKIEAFNVFNHPNFGYIAS
jgi:hypothetical protein